jgi:hypothetical protein
MTKNLKQIFNRFFLKHKGIKPNFLGIGVAKAGTTQISSLLRQHPEVYIPKNKELHFFDNDNFVGINNFSEYVSQFRYNRAIGEYTPSYLFIHEAPQKIKEMLDDNIKFLVALRNPVDRAFSHYCHAVNNWSEDRYRKLNYPIETLSFEEAIKQEDDRLKNGKYHIRHLSYFNKGLYSAQLKNYFRYFPIKNFYIYTLEDFSKNPQKILKEICLFLGIDTEFRFDNVNEKRNKQTNRELPVTTRNWLYSKYKNSINELEILLDRDFSYWK